MSGDPIEVRADGVYYLSDLDESFFFEWLDRLKCVARYGGEGTELRIVISSESVDDGDLRNLIALFYRYEVDLRQLRRFQNTSNEGWLTGREKYWFDRMFRDV
jgi:hypothetical protein